MPRKARVLVPNCPHHIVQRGHNRKAVFLAEQDYRYYIENLQEWKERLGIKIYAWCLMTNHVHVVAEPTQDVMTLSELMKRINGRQAAYVNKLEGRSGSLWEGRYKASPIQVEHYLLACIRYVELNPLRAGMVEDLELYPWSSYLARKEGGGDGLLDWEGCYLSLGCTKLGRWAAYRRLIAESLTADEEHVIRNGAQRNQLTGNDRFIDEIETRLGFRVERRGRGRPRADEK